MKLFHPWNNKRQAILLEQLSSYLSAGIPLDRALDIIADSSFRQIRASLRRVKDDVVLGSRLSSSLSRHVHLSSSLVGLIEHGESSGALSSALGAARQVIERTTEMTRRCVSALIYPSVIGCFSILLIIGLVRGVMPQITPMLKSLHVPLPLLTRSMMAITEFLMEYGVWILVGSPILVIGMFVMYAKATPIRRYCQRVFGLLPIIGHALSRYTHSVFLRSLGSLVASGMSVPEAFDRTAVTMSFLPLRDALRSCSHSVHAGMRLSQILKNVDAKIPSFVLALISVGEVSATLGTSLIRCADLIDQELDQSIKRLTSLIEPIMMAGMGGVVGSVALSIMLPIYDISKTLQH